MMNATAMATPAPYPVSFELARPERQSRLLIFVRGLLAIPQLLIAYALGWIASVVTFIAWFAILFTGKYPEGMFRFVVGIDRWRYNVVAYLFMLRDEYPPFSMDAGQYALAFDVTYPEHLSRWMIFVKWLLVIPNFIVFFVLLICAYVTTLIAWFAILFTGSYPGSLHRFAVGVLRWGARQNAYASLMTDRYPPFSLE
jgi:hypothetical protein